MKKASLLLAVALLFTLTAVAQDSGQAAPPSGQSSPSGMEGMNHKGMAKKGAGKTSTLTGCVSKEADSDGMYTLTNSHFKKGIEIGPTDQVQAHAGHEVKLTGKWASAAAAGETDTAATSGKEKGERHFEVSSLKHISDTCTPGAMASKKDKKAKGDMSNPQ